MSDVDEVVRDPTAVLQTAMSHQQREEQRLLDALAAIGGTRTTTDDIEFRGRKIILPETMTVGEVRRYLKRWEDAQEAENRYSRTFKYRPWDGAAAVMKATQRIFGTSGVGRAQYSFFGGKQPPEMRSIATGVDTTMQVPWGQISLPVFGEEAYMYLTGANVPELGILFQLIVDAPKKFAPHIEGLFTAIEDELRRSSIYKGQAVDGGEMPNFLDLSGVDPARVIYADETTRQLDANVWSLLEHTEAQERAGLPLKRAVLLEGPYGTGKTLAAMLTAQKAVANGWTFLNCRSGKDDLDATMATARLYQPAVVFFEDIDKVSDGSQDRDRVTQLLDLFDGISAKGTKLVIVLTTNHADRIHKGMVRPGRLDAVVHIGALDHGGVQRMIEAVVPDGIANDLDYEAIGTAMDGYSPAFTKEAIDRAIRYAIARSDGNPDMLTTQDFVDAAEGLRPQLVLMEGAKEGATADSVGAAIRREVRQAVHGATLVDVDDDSLGYRVEAPPQPVAANGNGH